MQVDVGDCCLICDDSLKVLPTFVDGLADAVVTDPPYGIGFHYASHDDNLEDWKSLMLASVPQMRRIARFVIMPCCSITRLPWWYTTIPPDWLVAWVKGSPGQRAKVGFSAWEAHVCFGRPKVPMHDCFSTRCGFEGIDCGHPCPKPLDWAKWLVRRAAPKGGLIVDPFMGSGTTGIACRMLGRRYIGIEKDPQYFKIAEERVRCAPLMSGFGIEDPQPPEAVGFW